MKLLATAALTAFLSVAGGVEPAIAQDKTVMGGAVQGNNIELIQGSDDEYSEDDLAIVRAYDALHASQFQTVVDEVDAVIDRFDQSKKRNATYYCGSGPDALAILFGASLGLYGDGAPTTVVVPPAFCEAYFLKGFALIDLGKPDEALSYLKTAVTMDTDNQHYLNELAEWYKVDKNWKKSLALFTEASEMEQIGEDSDWEAVQCRSLRGIGFNQIELRDFDAARTAFGACLELIPDDPGTLNELQYIEQVEKSRT